MIGLCADTMLTKKVCAEKIYPYEKRKNDLTEDIDAILVTPEVRKNAEEINEVRKAKGWNTLEIVEISFLKDEKGVISSTRLRQSEERD